MPSDEVLASRPGEAPFGAADERARANGAAPGASSPAPAVGSAEFAALCRRLDGRPLGYRAFKRAFDIVFSALVIAVGLVPGLILSVAVARDTGGSPIYSQVRVGKRGRPFRIYKFRSMVADSDDVEKYFTPEQLEVWRRERKVDDDPRVTRLGARLRGMSLDELPQFVNVLLGQISLIGPRVITEDELLQHFGPQERARLLSVAPGITGAWQAGPRNTATFENGERQAVELGYARDAGLREDARIFFRTIRVMLVEKTGK